MLELEDDAEGFFSGEGALPVAEEGLLGLEQGGEAEGGEEKKQDSCEGGFGGSCRGGLSWGFFDCGAEAPSLRMTFYQGKCGGDCGADGPSLRMTFGLRSMHE